MQEAWFWSIVCTSKMGCEWTGKPPNCSFFVSSFYSLFDQLYIRESACFRLFAALNDTLDGSSKGCHFLTKTPNNSLSFRPPKTDIVLLTIRRSCCVLSQTHKIHPWSLKQIEFINTLIKSLFDRAIEPYFFQFFIYFF
jgi:hypothetical protein